MNRKSMFTNAIIIATALTLSTGLSGCGKQEVEPVFAATVEEVTPTSEITTEESVSVATEEETESIEETTIDEAETESIAVQDYTITELNQEMQVTQNAATYESPNTNTKVSEVQQNEVVKVIGIVDGSDWYQIEQSDNTKSFIDGIFLKDIEQPKQEEVQTPATEVQQPQQQEQQQPQEETPKENPQQPVDPPVDTTPSDDNTGGKTFLPDGSVMLDDGTVIHPGDQLPGAIYGGSGNVHGLY